MQSIKKQKGAVLMVGLIIVLVLSLLVLSATRTTILQQKMASNLRDSELAFQAAESALKSGENFLQTSEKKQLAGIFDDSDGLYTFDAQREFKTREDWDAIESVSTDALYQVRENPAYVIEELDEIVTLGDSLALPKKISGEYYRITAKSKGGTDASFVVLQSMYKK